MPRPLASSAGGSLLLDSSRCSHVAVMPQPPVSPSPPSHPRASLHPNLNVSFTGIHPGHDAQPPVDPFAGSRSDAAAATGAVDKAAFNFLPVAPAPPSGAPAPRLSSTVAASRLLKTSSAAKAAAAAAVAPHEAGAAAAAPRPQALDSPCQNPCLPSPRDFPRSSGSEDMREPATWKPGRRAPASDVEEYCSDGAANARGRQQRHSRRAAGFAHIGEGGRALQDKQEEGWGRGQEAGSPPAAWPVASLSPPAALSGASTRRMSLLSRCSSNKKGEEGGKAGAVDSRHLRNRSAGAEASLMPRASSDDHRPEQGELAAAGLPTLPSHPLAPRQGPSAARTPRGTRREGEGASSTPRGDDGRARHRRCSSDLPVGLEWMEMGGASGRGAGQEGAASQAGSTGPSKGHRGEAGAPPGQLLAAAAGPCSGEFSLAPVQAPCERQDSVVFFGFGSAKSRGAGAGSSAHAAALADAAAAVAQPEAASGSLLDVHASPEGSPRGGAPAEGSPPSLSSGGGSPTLGLAAPPVPHHSRSRSAFSGRPLQSRAQQGRSRAPTDADDLYPAEEGDLYGGDASDSGTTGQEGAVRPSLSGKMSARGLKGELAAAGRVRRSAEGSSKSLSDTEGPSVYAGRRAAGVPQGKSLRQLRSSAEGPVPPSPSRGRPTAELQRDVLAAHAQESGSGAAGALHGRASQGGQQQGASSAPLGSAVRRKVAASMNTRGWDALPRVPSEAWDEGSEGEAARRSLAKQGADARPKQQPASRLVGSLVSPRPSAAAAAPVQDLWGAAWQAGSGGRTPLPPSSSRLPLSAACEGTFAPAGRTPLLAHVLASAAGGSSSLPSSPGHRPPPAHSRAADGGSLHGAWSAPMEELQGFARKAPAGGQLGRSRLQPQAAADPQDVTEAFTSSLLASAESSSQAPPHLRPSFLMKPRPPQGAPSSATGLPRWLPPHLSVESPGHSPGSSPAHSALGSPGSGSGSVSLLFSRSSNRIAFSPAGSSSGGSLAAASPRYSAGPPSAFSSGRSPGVSPTNPSPPSSRHNSPSPTGQRLAARASASPTSSAAADFFADRRSATPDASPSRDSAAAACHKSAPVSPEAGVAASASFRHPALSTPTSPEQPAAAAIASSPPEPRAAPPVVSDTGEMSDGRVLRDRRLEKLRKTARGSGDLSRRRAKDGTAGPSVLRASGGAVPAGGGGGQRTGAPAAALGTSTRVPAEQRVAALSVRKVESPNSSSRAILASYEVQQLSKQQLAQLLAGAPKSSGPSPALSPSSSLTGPDKEGAVGGAGGAAAGLSLQVGSSRGTPLVSPLASPRAGKEGDARSPHGSCKSDLEEGASSSTGRSRRRRESKGQSLATQEEAKKLMEAAIGAMKSVVRNVRKSSRDNVVSRTYSSIADKYVMHQDELGSGQYGVIRKCMEIKTGKVFACKTIDKANIKSHLEAEDIRKEVASLKILQPHPSIVFLKDTFEDEKHVHIVMELCKGGDLFDRLVARGSLSEPTAARLCRAMVQALGHCHRHRCIHRDIKPENILLVSKTSDFDIKLVDFGVATFFEPGKKLTEVMGTPEYMAPELIRGSYGPEVDIFSAGVIMYTAMCGVPPFWASSRDAVKEAILTREVRFRFPKWLTVSDECKQLIAWMLEKDPSRRATPAQILDHPWIRKWCEPHRAAAEP